MAQSKHVCTPPLPVHRCTDHDCIYLGQPSGKSCACHKTREQMLVEQNAELLAALENIMAELSSNPAKEPTLRMDIAYRIARAAIAKAEGGAA